MQNRRPSGSTRKSASRGGSRRKSNIDKSNRRLAWILGLAVVAVVVALAFSAHGGDKATATEADGSLEAVITNPDLPEKLISYTGMTVSFNPETHQPNWVSWELLPSETDGESGRSDKFRGDDSVEGSAETWDYSYSGYDRGHMAPAGDMKWSPKAMEESFLMTNICPQAADLNRGSWKKLEEKCRQKAIADSAIIIVCGPIFRKGEAVERIGETGVAVPRQFFKVILSPYADPPTAIGFIMPNGPVPGGMQTHAVSVDSVEAVTGHDFFSALPDQLEQQLEKQCNFPAWSRIRRNKR